MVGGLGGAIARLWIEFGADNSGLLRGVAESRAALTGFTTAAETSVRRIERVGADVTKVGRALSIGVSVPLLAGGAAALKVAVDFESAFAGVRKTVNATEPELAKLRQGIIDMSKEVPATTTEIARVAEAAGQLGIATPNILTFTRTMIDLGETTNLSADVAADALARLANITQMPQSQFDRLGSTVVALGNNLAATESEIVGMGTRIASAGNQIGLTEAQILGLAGALSSVGIESEAGGTAISRVMIEVAKAVDMGGEKLELFATTAGMSTAEFRRSFEQDAAGTIVRFVEGLDDVSAAGGSMFTVMEDLSLGDVRVGNALRAMAGAGDLLRESLDLGTRAWGENNALQVEAQKRYETTAAQLEIVRNEVMDAGRQFGELLVPALAAGARGLSIVAAGASEVAQAIDALPGPLQAVVGGFGALVVAAGPAMFLGGKIAQNWRLIAQVGPSVANAFTNFRLGMMGATDAGAGLSNRMGTTARALGPAGLLGATAAVSGALMVGAAVLDDYRRKKEEARQRVIAFTDAILADADALGENTRAAVQNDLAQNKQLDDLGRLAGYLSSGRSALDVYTEAVYGNVDAQREFRQALLDSGEVKFLNPGLSPEKMRELQRAWVETGNTMGRSLSVLVEAEGPRELVEDFNELIGTYADAAKAAEAVNQKQRTAADVQRQLSAAQAELNDLAASGVASDEELAAAGAKVTRLQAEQKRITDAVAGATGTLGGEAANTAGDFAGLGGATEDLMAKLARLHPVAFAAIGTFKASQSAARSVASLDKALADLRGELDDVGGSAGGAGGATQTAAQKMWEARDRARALTDAQRGLADANRRVGDAARSLADAQANVLDVERSLEQTSRDREDALRQVIAAEQNLQRIRDAAPVDTADAFEQARIDKAQADLDLADAEAELDKVRKDTQSSPVEIERAELALARARLRAKQQATEFAQAEQTYNAVLSGHPEVLDEVRDAQDRLTDARARAEEADQAIIEIQTALEDAQRKVVDQQLALEDANYAVETAALAVQRAEATLRGEFDSTAGSAGGAAQQVKSYEEKLRDAADAAFEAAWQQTQLAVALGLTNDPLGTFTGYLQGIIDKNPELKPILDQLLTTLKNDVVEVEERFRKFTDRLADPKWRRYDIPSVPPGGGSGALRKWAGGPIPGTKNTPVPIIAHGGEYVLSADVVDRIRQNRPSRGADMRAAYMGADTLDAETPFGARFTLDVPESTATGGFDPRSLDAGWTQSVRDTAGYAPPTANDFQLSAGLDDTNIVDAIRSLRDELGRPNISVIAEYDGDRIAAKIDAAQRKRSLLSRR